MRSLSSEHATNIPQNPKTDLRTLQLSWLRHIKDGRRRKSAVYDVSPPIHTHLNGQSEPATTSYLSRTGDSGVTVFQDLAGTAAEPPKVGFLSAWLNVLSPMAPSSRALSPTEDINDFYRGSPSKLQLHSRGSNEMSSSHGQVDERITWPGAPRTCKERLGRPTVGQKKDSWFRLKRKISTPEEKDLLIAEGFFRGSSQAAEPEYKDKTTSSRTERAVPR